MTPRPILPRSAFLAGAAALAVAPAALRAADLPAAAPAVIRAGTIPADVAAVITYAGNLGYFKDAGLDVQIQLMQSGPVIAPAVIGGTLDVGAANIASIAAARERGLLLKFFAPAGLATPQTLTDVVMVKKDSPIKTYADLDGKTVAIVATKTMQDAAFRLLIDKHGGDSKTVKLIEIPFPEMIGALDTGRVDAAIPSEPFTSQGLADNRVLGGVYASMPGTILVFGFFATDAWLQAHPDLAVKFAGAIRKAAVWANAHPAESSQMLVAFTKLDPQLAATMRRAVYATSLDPSMLQPVLDNAVRYGMLEKPIDASELIWQPPAK
jgi:NitT/TauT family transport system substrate-binding protein